MSGLSNPVGDMPQDIYVTLWSQICDKLVSGDFAVTKEVYEELTHITGPVGDCIVGNEVNLVLEVGDASWDWEAYVEHTKTMHAKYEQFILGTGGSKVSLSMPDLSIVALGKTLSLPVVSMEKPVAHQTDNKRKIPDICKLENVDHMTFNDLLRAEGIKL